MRVYDEDGNFSRDIEWTLEYNDLNQLTKRFSGSSWTGETGDRRVSYDYDDNGNLTEKIEQENVGGGVWDEVERWVYDWNPRDQMTRAMKWAGSSGSTNNVGSVEYQYCLACDDALSKRFVYGAGSGSTKGALESGQRYEYDGLNLLRVDELSGSTLSESGPWRTLEGSTHRLGTLGSLLAKRVYTHTDNDAAPDETNDFFYTYDPVGNVVTVTDADGDEVYFFTQDAFGNEVSVASLGGSDWGSAANIRIMEHQTGKWRDGFTGLYYFWARWYDSGVGRFVSRDPDPDSIGLYVYSNNNPMLCTDPNGYCGRAIHYEETYSVAWAVLGKRTCRGDDGRLVARQIAESDEGTDSGATGPWWSVTNRIDYHCFGYYNEGADHIRRRDNERMNARYGEMLHQALQCCDSEYLGRALHFRQDCFIHWDWHETFGHVIDPDLDKKCEDDPMRTLIRQVTHTAIERFSGRCCK